MLDNLRDDDSSKPFFEDEEAPVAKGSVSMSEPSRSSGRFLGMTPTQRFVIAMLMMVMVCVLGAMCLLITGKIGIYF